MPFSNASLLSLLTISHQNGEHIIFAYLKELDDIAPSEISWHFKKGKNGNADFLWEQKKLKQWLVTGSDSDITKLWERLKCEDQVFYNWPDNINVVFKLPSLKKHFKDDMYFIEGICRCERDENPDEYISESIKQDISFLLQEQTNCNFIEGYKKHDSITPISPPGLFQENFLFNKLKEKVIAVHQKRNLFWTLQGEGKDVDSGDPTSLSGFIQAENEFKMNHKIVIKDLDGNELIGESDIDVVTGKWKALLIKPIGKGQFLIMNKEAGVIYCGEKFYLIKEFKLNTQIVNNVLVDLYKRDINLIGEKPKVVPLKEPLVWDVLSAPDNKQGEIELSDKLRDVLLSLGDKIIFNDPYIFGDFKEENGVVKLKSKSQSIFLNALITALAIGQIKEITFLGNWYKLKRLFKDDKQLLINRYKMLYELIKLNLKPNILKLTKFEIVLAEQSFHDRYWLSNQSESNTIYHISNSINGAFENQELRIMPVNDIDKLKNEPRLLNRFKGGEHFNLMLK